MQNEDEGALPPAYAVVDLSQQEGQPPVYPSPSFQYPNEAIISPMNHVAASNEDIAYYSKNEVYASPISNNKHYPIPIPVEGSPDYRNRQAVPLRLEIPNEGRPPPIEISSFDRLMCPAPCRRWPAKRGLICGCIYLFIEAITSIIDESSDIHLIIGGNNMYHVFRLAFTVCLIVTGFFEIRGIRHRNRKQLAKATIGLAVLNVFQCFDIVLRLSQGHNDAVSLISIVVFLIVVQLMMRTTKRLIAALDGIHQ